MSRTTIPTTAIALALGALGATGAVAQPSLSQSNGVEWVCDGVGADARAALAALESRTNVKLVFVHGERAGYVADVQMQLSTADGRVLLDAMSPGPICLLRLAPGNYRLQAAFAGAARERMFRVSEGSVSGEPQRVAIVFPAQRASQYSASAEEKSQARAMAR